MLELAETATINQKIKAIDLLGRPQVNIIDLLKQIPEFYSIENEIPLNLKTEILESCEIEIKYKGYIEREKQLANKLLKFEELIIPNDFEYDKISSLSTEARQKLLKIKPQTIGQALRIPGVSPSDINIILIFLGR